MRYLLLFLPLALYGMQEKKDIIILPHKHHHKNDTIVIQVEDKKPCDEKKMQMKYKIALIGGIATVTTTAIGAGVALAIHLNK